MLENIGINLISSGICFLIGIFAANYRRIGLFVKSLIHWSKDILNIIFENKRGFYEKEDLRFCTKGKNISKVLNWFDSRENREVAVYREFYEEIIKNNILPIEVLSSMRIEFLKQIKPKMAYSKHFKKNEILLFDIYEIHLTNEYIDMMYKYVKEENDLIKLVDREDIEKECVDIRGKSFKIGAHSQYII
ncbi:Uncharacterised protein [Streptococcus anginosus]|uniref:CD-NTase-associated protein 16 NUDIX domain-containing protein n=1 Tax=Streptococcus anginosus TaxID=1328 RepID=A0A4U9ZDI6_STRAP|nr:hypothetical protein [Streptococcus anginosus]VTS37716.1 Uncharacterised protein [Streptococcus anginosus]